MNDAVICYLIKISNRLYKVRQKMTIKSIKPRVEYSHVPLDISKKSKILEKALISLANSYQNNLVQAFDKYDEILEQNLDTFEYFEWFQSESSRYLDDIFKPQISIIKNQLSQTLDEDQLFNKLNNLFSHLNDIMSSSYINKSV